MFDKFKQLYDLQKQARAIQKELGAIIVSAEVAGGKVRVEMTGDQKIKSIFIDSSLCDPKFKPELENLIKEAIAAVIVKSQRAAAEKMREIGGLPGLL